jgi:hypothetical protein
MRTRAAPWSLMFLCCSMAGAVGGGRYEHLVLMPLWAASPPSSLALIQPGTGVPPASVVDSCPCGHHGVPALVAGLGVAGEEGPPVPAHRTWLVYHHARLERALLHPREAGVSTGTAGCPGIVSAHRKGLSVDVLDVVQSTTRRTFVSFFSPGAFGAGQT